MGYAFPAEWNLAPGVAENLNKRFGPPPAPAPAADNYDAPDAAELARYGAKPAEIAVAQAANAHAPGQSPAAPALQKGWTPEVDTRRAEAAAAEARKDAPDALPPEDDDDAPRRSPGVYVPPHWQPVDRREAVRYGIPDAKLEPAQSAYESATGHSLEANEKHLEASQQRGMADAVEATARFRASQIAAEQMQRQQAEKERYIQAEHAKLAQLSAEAQKQVDPEAAKGSIGAQLFGAIAVGLGQFGASLTGGTNTALQIVNANIDRSIKAQEMNIANAGKAHDREASLYHQNLEAFGDRERAVLATKMQYLEQVKAMADQQYAAAKNTMNIGDKHALDAGVMKQLAEYKTDWAKLTADTHETNASEHYMSGQTVGGGAVAKDLPNLVTLPNGSTVQAKNEQQANKIIDQARIVDRLQRMNNRATKLRQELFGLSSVNPLNQGKREAIKGQLEDMEIEKTSLLSGKDGEGVQRDSEFARNVAKRGFFTAGTSRVGGIGYDRAAADANLKAQNERAEADMTAFAVAGGARVVHLRNSHDAQGNVVPGAVHTGQTAWNDEQLAPHGSKPMKVGTHLPTAAAPLDETTPYDADSGEIVSSASASGKAGKGGKGGFKHVKGTK